MIAVSDVKWRKVKTEYSDGNETHVCVIGELDDAEIGHYLYDHEENTVSCIFRVEEKDGSSIFLNRTYVLDGKNRDDNFFRERIINAYNNFQFIKDIFD